ncbi:MAG: PrgI family protein, partial [Candidatus Woesebacteria bacterium]|nr:PrgI family protein [Candidatus Woesebacteria bacterium]
MEQHPIPQNVSSYQFKLVGDMTLKQFFQLAGGFLVAFIFYSSPLIGIVKWPFVIVSAILGAAMAFVPLEERPLERWIFAFFRAIYSPTEFFWKKTAAPVKFFQDEASGPEGLRPGGQVSTEQEAALKAYLAAKQNSGPFARFEVA